jgi:transcriptional regulator with XRE-family HTH domain
LAFTGSEIKKLRQRLGWSVAEMARRLGCDSELIHAWECGSSRPDNDALNQMHSLQQYADANSHQTAQKPQLEKETETRQLSQMNRHDLN